MTTLTDRPPTALVVVDVQVGVVAEARDRDRGRREHRHGRRQGPRRRHAGRLGPALHPEFLPRDSEGWGWVPELEVQESEPVVHKTYADSFEETDLEEVLAARGVGRLVVAGAQTDECIRSTLHGALVRGYDATLVADAHTTEDQSEYGAPTPDLVIAHTNLYWTYHRAPGREAGGDHRGASRSEPRRAARAAMSRRVLPVGTDMTATNLAELYDLPPLEWQARSATHLDAGIAQAPGAGGPDRHTVLADDARTADGSPHVTGCRCALGRRRLLVRDRRHDAQGPQPGRGTHAAPSAWRCVSSTWSSRARAAPAVTDPVVVAARAADVGRRRAGRARSMRAVSR